MEPSGYTTKFQRTSDAQDVIRMSYISSVYLGRSFTGEKSKKF